MHFNKDNRKTRNRVKENEFFSNMLKIFACLEYIYGNKQLKTFVVLLNSLMETNFIFQCTFTRPLTLHFACDI